MALPARLEIRAKVWPARSRVFRGGALLRTAKPPDGERHPALSTAELAFHVYAAFRAHPHINNVLTHISRADWSGLERSLNSILDPAAASDGLSPLEQNIIELMCAGRGITGTILKPYFHDVLYKLLEPDYAERLIHQIQALFRELEWKAQNPAPPAPNEPPLESGHVGSEA